MQSHQRRIRSLVGTKERPIRPVDIGRELISASIAGLEELAAKLDATALDAAGTRTFAFRSLTSTISLCQTLFIALATRLELDLSKTHDPDGEEPED